MDREAGSAGTDRRRDTAGVIAPPPALFGAALIAGLLLQRAAPLGILPGRARLLRLTGAALMIPGFALSAAVMRVFRKAATPVAPMRPTRRLVCTGPYRYSRNPDYVGQTLVYLGAALAANSWWPLLLLPPVLVALERGVVEREERYLEGKFGEEYREYKARVPRWLPVPPWRRG